MYKKKNREIFLRRMSEITPITSINYDKDDIGYYSNGDCDFCDEKNNECITCSSCWEKTMCVYNV